MFKNIGGIVSNVVSLIIGFVLAILMVMVGFSLMVNAVTVAIVGKAPESWDEADVRFLKTMQKLREVFTS
jgi:hypothetical protein